MNFRKIALSDAPLFHSYLSRMDSVSCEMNFANLFLWSLQSENFFCEHKNRLVVKSIAENCFFFPLGEFFPPSELAEFGAIIYDTPPEYLEKYPETSHFFRLETSADNADYIYDLEQLYTMNGHRLRKKRNLVKQFLSSYPSASTGELSSGNFAEFTLLAARLFASVEHTESLEKELKMWPHVLKYLFTPELKLSTFTLAIEEKMIGFAIYSPLGGKCFDIHFEKIDHNFKGAPQYFVQQLAGKLMQYGKLMNREQDLGLPGLRQAKASLDPVQLHLRTTLIPF